MDSVGAQLLAKLRTFAPAAVRAFDAAGEVREIAVPGGRKRWSACAATIEARQWQRVDFLDGKGRVLGHHDNDAPAEGLEDISAPPQMVQAKWYLDSMMRAQDMALSHRAKEFTAIFGGVNQLLELQAGVITEQIAWMRQQREDAIEMERLKAAAHQAGTADTDDWGQVVQLLESSPKIMEAIGPLLALVMRPRLPPAPPAPPAPRAAPPAPPAPPAAPPPPPPAPPPGNPRNGAHLNPRRPRRPGGR